jgi:hypothetical protein
MGVNPAKDVYTEPSGTERNGAPLVCKPSVRGSTPLAGMLGSCSLVGQACISMRDVSCPPFCPPHRRHTATLSGTIRHVIGGRVASDDSARYHPTRRIGSPNPQVAG